MSVAISLNPPAAKLTASVSDALAGRVRRALAAKDS